MTKVELSESYNLAISKITRNVQKMLMRRVLSDRYRIINYGAGAPPIALAITVYNNTRKIPVQSGVSVTDVSGLALQVNSLQFLYLETLNSNIKSRQIKLSNYY